MLNSFLLMVSAGVCYTLFDIGVMFNCLKRCNELN